jgi:hypothetical protein
LAEAGVDLPVMQALMGHDHVDSAAAYIHLSPAHVRRAYDDARLRQRSQNQTSGGSRWWGVLCFGVGECVVVVVGWGVWLWWVGCVGVGVYWLVV